MTEEKKREIKIEIMVLNPDKKEFKLLTTMFSAMPVSVYEILKRLEIIGLAERNPRDYFEEDFHLESIARIKKNKNQVFEFMVNGETGKAEKSDDPHALSVNQNALLYIYPILLEKKGLIPLSLKEILFGGKRMN